MKKLPPTASQPVVWVAFGLEIEKVGFSPTKYVVSTTFSKNLSCFLKKDILPHEVGAKTTEKFLSEFYDEIFIFS
jgi:hypothetical protein